MRTLNRILAALTVTALIFTGVLLIFLQRRAAAEMENAVAAAVRAFPHERILHGPGGDTMVHFAAAEDAARLALGSPYLANVFATRLVRGKEYPIVPFDLAAKSGGNLSPGLAGLRREPLGNPATPWGFLYLKVDASVVRSVNWALGAVGMATALILVTLLARLWSQETSLTRTTIELHERRRELIRLERLALAGQLAAGLLHDLRKPVLHVQHSLDDLAEALGDFAPAATALQDMKRQTRVYFQLLGESGLERFVQSDRSGPEYVDILPVIDQALNLVRYERRGVEVLIRDAPVLPPVLAHPHRLIQLFSNIILNAYQALRGEGRLTIETIAEEGGVHIDFIDTGPGIPPDLMLLIFDPFFTTKAEGQGTGLGLSICRLIVEDLGGKISVLSSPGSTTFKVHLPAGWVERETVSRQ